MKIKEIQALSMINKSNLKVEEEIKQFCKKQKVDYRIYFHHGR